MRHLVALMVAGMMISGCAIATIETKGKGPDAATCKATYMSGLKSLSDIEMKACGAQGQAGSSTVDPAFVNLIDLLHKLTNPVAIPKPEVKP